MKILCVGQIEDKDKDSIATQIEKQTVQPDVIRLHLDETPAEGINERRKRIVENHTFLTEIVNEEQPDLVWQVEGDSWFEPDTLERLLAHHKKMSMENANLGYVSGVQVGRHGLYTLGAWQFEEDGGFHSLDFKAKGLQSVDATGFYCLLAETDVWLKGTPHWTNEPYGPDVNFGLSLKNQGFDIFADPELHIGHIYKNGIIKPTSLSTCNVRFFERNNRWEYVTYS